MKVITTQAVILRTRDYAESDRLVAFFSEAEGRLGGIAKGARRSRRRFANCLETGSLVQISYRVRRSLVWVESCKLIEPYGALRMQIERWALGALVCEIFLEMAPEGEPHGKWFDLLKLTLQNLSEDREPFNAALLFLLRFMDLGGYLPALNECSLCRAPLKASRSWKWHVGKGTLLCSGHRPAGRESVGLDLGSLVLMELCRKIPMDKIWRHRFSQDKRGPLFNGLVSLICSHTGRELKSLRTLRQLRLV